MELIIKALEAYSIYPVSIEKVTDRLFRVYDGKHEYALKRSLLSDRTLANWESVYRQAHSQNMAAIMPVYLTKAGDLYKKSDQSIYYLTPWILVQKNESQKQSIEQFYYTIGMIHAKTKQSQLIQMDKLKSDFSTYQTFCEETKGMLLDYVKRFEKNQYMSPFELMVCTQYRDLEFALNTVKRRLDQFLYEDEEQLTWNDCLIHGNLKLSHLVNHYIINWEYAQQGNAVLDLAKFYQQETVEFGNKADLFIELFSVYNKENELKLKEHYLLIIYLLNPTAYISKIQDYMNKSSDLSMVDQIQLLQHAYRQVIFGLKWSSFVEKEYESFSLDDLEG